MRTKFYKLEIGTHFFNERGDLCQKITDDTAIQVSTGDLLEVNADDWAIEAHA